MEYNFCFFLDELDFVLLRFLFNWKIQASWFSSEIITNSLSLSHLDDSAAVSASMLWTWSFVYFHLCQDNEYSTTRNDWSSLVILLLGYNFMYRHEIKKINLWLYSSQGSHTGQLNLCNLLAVRRDNVISITLRQI